MSSLVLVLLVAATSPIEPAPSAEGATLSPLDRYSFSIGGFHFGSDTTISARAGIDEYSADGSFNLEDDLGLDQRHPVAIFRLEYLTTPTQGLWVEYFGYRRENELRLSRQIVFDGTTYDASARVLGRIDYDFVSTAYRWWFGDGATVYGLGAGVAWYKVDTLLEGEASLNDEVVEASTSSSDSAFAPLLVLGWRHAFSEHWRVYADLSGVAKEGGALNGHIVEGAVGIEWFPTRHVGLALEYGHTRIKLRREREYYDARLDLVLQGPMLFVRIR
jgi:hypothetical protein